MQSEEERFKHERQMIRQEQIERRREQLRQQMIEDRKKKALEEKRRRRLEAARVGYIHRSLAQKIDRLQRGHVMMPNIR